MYFTLYKWLPIMNSIQNFLKMSILSLHACPIGMVLPWESLQRLRKYHFQCSGWRARHSFFYKHTGKLCWSSICWKFPQSEPKTMLDDMLNFKTHFMVWYWVWFEHCNGLFQMFELEHSVEFDMNATMVSLTFEIL